MSTIDSSSSMAGQRGPTEHGVRDQIVDAAREHFSRFGYGKTTVADLAKAIGFSKAYIYKFFDSKQAIGQAICTQTLEQVFAGGTAGLVEGKSASDKLRRFFNGIVTASAELFFEDKMLYDIAAHAAEERWPSVIAYMERAEETLKAIILAGREAGEFERKTPIDETCEAILLAMQSFMNPLMLKHNLEGLPEDPAKVINLVLRSLAP
ncbi:TetR/AcrR family transcriptional regulator [Caulobacter segnis]|uniref:Transcriptional regulator, TetR family n=2 Tax=Caulobacter segnis TaxID=88688 RepID=D5VGR6_CAUST|nr:TetR/AcrR family transcriptional regulator [Caulobacter segnis]ADG10509.1 transcriptional regulator, TetR family [Caulobacter segnis ATCC 21756]AVQ02232.1 TetR/AcrR family transcriptional regulator [Caulobacter segnis]